MLCLAAIATGAAAYVATSDSECTGIMGNCLCDEGVTQSPINLHTCNKEIDDELYNIPLEREEMEVMYGAEEGTIKRRCKARSDGGPDDCNLVLIPQNDVTHSNNLNVPGFGVYNLEECVIRMPAEHTVNNWRYAMEMQCHHTLEGTEGKRKGIVSTFYENGMAEDEEGNKAETSSGFVEGFASKLPGGNEAILLKPFSFSPMGGAGLTRYYSYRGSQTTGNCAENVDWFVMYDPTGISKAQKSKLRDAFGRNETDQTTWMPPRHLQPAYGRHADGCHHHHDAAPAVGCFVSLAVMVFSVLGRA